MSEETDHGELIDWGSSETFSDGPPLLSGIARTLSGLVLAVALGVLFAAIAL